jgi:transcriptional regulator with XRE-family HTH domain
MANTENKSLGTVIRDARVKSGRSLREFAKLLDITPSYQSDIENDRRVPAEDLLKN